MVPLEQGAQDVGFVAVPLCVGFCQILLLYQDYGKWMNFIPDSVIRSAEATESGLSAQTYRLLL